jgi:ubiquinone/menaquinone biosynthesis C-methylase UbiE
MAVNDFEKEYYEADSFWSGEMVNDAANKRRIELTGEFISQDVKTVVDIGCGNGVFLNFLKAKNRFSKLLGVERSETALRYVTTDKIQASIDKIPITDRSFDCVTCLEVLEHLPCDIYQQSLEELARVSDKYIIISVPYNEVLEDSYNRCPQCRTIFNYELHFRSFNDDAIKNLFASMNFDCVRTITTGTGVRLKGHRKFLRVFHPESFHNWRSPICPLCGFRYPAQQQSERKAEVISGEKTATRKLISYLTFLPKLFWPKEQKDYWIIALYKRRN